jgi:hypothetical protein
VPRPLRTSTLPAFTLASPDMFFNNRSHDRRPARL